MTPKFITPCYVRVEDKDKRKEVCEELERMGYVNTWHSACEDQVLVTAISGSYLDVISIEDNVSVNCGTNAELFLALAGMRSDTDKGQWFNTIGSEYRKESWILCQSHQIYDDSLSGEYRKATAQEIVEHFSQPTV